MKWNANTWRCLPGMEIQVFYNNLSGILEHPVLLAPMESLLGHTGDEILGMARCYLTDGTCFMKKDDPVNTVADFCICGRLAGYRFIYRNFFTRPPVQNSFI